MHIPFCFVTFEGASLMVRLETFAVGVYTEVETLMQLQSKDFQLVNCKNRCM